MTRRRTAAVALLCVLGLFVATATWWLLRAPAGTQVTAYFDRAVGLYAGSDVRVLGVKVGKVDRVTPVGPVVRVELTVRPEFPIPPNASAAVVAPSLVSDRYVQLTPAYVDGPAMASGAVIPRERTATPVEIDELLRSVDTLSTALGPNGANSTGALSAALDTAAANLRGNGPDLNTTMTRLGELAGTLNRSRGDLFATVNNLNRFTATLADSDAQVRDFQDKLADVTGYLAGERGQVGDTLGALAGALGEVNSFLGDNRELVSSNVHRLTGITQALVDERKAIAEVIDVAPLGASNYLGSYDAASGAVAVRGDFSELALSPVVLLCTILQRYTPPTVPAALRDACVSAARGLDKVVPLPSPAQVLGDLQQGTLPLPGAHR
jgi:phospholipid/cholesterol/gamma-HCH transport system substrate-binding protein